MAEGVMMVFAAAHEGQAETLDAWYEAQHVRDLLAVPGIKQVRRYDLRTLRMPDGGPGWDFLGLYSLEADDLDGVLKEASVRMGTAQMPRSPALNSARTMVFLAEEKSFAE